jgi:predicted RNA-binding protein
MKMCESSVYVLKEGKEELVLESLDLLENKGGQIKMVSMYGEERTIKAKVKSLSLVNHKIILEPR